MAREVLTVAGAAVGFFFGGPIGASLGAQAGGLVGGLVDPGPTVQGPRLNALSVTASTYGTPIPLIYGPTNRIAGNIIWSSGLIESKETTRTGGKGGGGQKVENYSYRVSLAIALGQGVMQGIRRVWANSKLLFDIDELSTPPPAPTADVGMVVVTGTGDIPDSSYGRQDGGVFAVLRFYQGNGTQQVDPTIESYLGVGQTPAYRHTAYIVIQDLQLADFGNILPNIEVEVMAHESITVGRVVRDICERAGITDASMSSITTELRGYVVAQGGPAYAAIRPLTRAYNFDLAEQCGQIRCVRRGQGLRGVIPITDMGARVAADGGHIEPLRLETLSDLHMPQEVAVSYADPDMDYQVNTQLASRAAGSTENNLRVEIPLVLTADEARALADRELWEAWSGRRTARFNVSDRWVGLSPGDTQGIPVGSNVIPHRIGRVTRGHDGVIEIEAVYEDPEPYRSTAAGAPAHILPNPIRLPGPTRAVLMNTPILRDEDDNTGFYWVASGENVGWRGGVLQRSVDDGVSFTDMAPIDIRAVIGDVATALPPGPADIWDRGNKLTVVLHYERDELESLSELNVLNGGNAAWIGPPNGISGEIIQFTTATLVAPQTYELSGLLRGRRGTEYAIDLHGNNEVFVLLQFDTLRRNDFGLSDKNQVRVYRPVSSFTAPIDNATQEFTNVAEGLTPFSPVHVRGQRDESNNLTITWFRRTRYSVPGLGRGLVPLGEGVEAYKLWVMDGFTTRRVFDASTPSVVYTAAEQIEDGLTPGDPVDVWVFQISADGLYGDPAIYTV